MKTQARSPLGLNKTPEHRKAKAARLRENREYRAQLHKMKATKGASERATIQAQIDEISKRGSN